MENLKLEEFEIRVTKDGEIHKMAWKGKCEFRSPSEIINPYIVFVLDLGEIRELKVDFRGLEFMNSSTFPALLAFMKNCDKKEIPTTFYYSANSEWQSASFKPLIAIAKTLKNLKIEAI